MNEQPWPPELRVPKRISKTTDNCWKNMEAVKNVGE